MTSKALEAAMQAARDLELDETLEDIASIIRAFAENVTEEMARETHLGLPNRFSKWMGGSNGVVISAHLAKDQIRSAILKGLEP